MLKVGLVGCGVIAPLHIKAIGEISELELYAVCDIIKERADTFAETHGAKVIYYDYDEMLQDSNIDIVAICTPSGLHGEMAIKAIKAKKNIMCEKPMEITKEKLDEVVEAYKNSDVKFACVFQRRVAGIAKKVKEALDRGDLGKILVADTYLKYYRSAEYYKSGDWRATWEMDGGGALMNQGVHGVDLMSWFMGGVDSLSAICRTQLHDIKVEDAAVSIVEYKNGAIGVIEGTTCVNPAQNTRFEIHGERGSIIFDDNGVKQWIIDGKDIDITDKASAEFNGGADALVALQALSHTPLYIDLVECIKADKETFVSPIEGRKAVDTILAIYKSSKEKKVIKL